METLIDIITRHAEYAHWYIFGAILLAGFNIPFSADLLILLSAFIAASIFPEHLWHLYFSILLGCYFSAWCAYWLGRLLGGKLQKSKWFSQLLRQDRIEKVRKFYERYGVLTLILGRFIPFGVRNCIFMSTGLSKLSFLRFAIMDALACSLWCSISFYTFYSIGNHFQVIYEHLKTFNLFVFLAFAVAGISIIWYKLRRKIPSPE